MTPTRQAALRAAIEVWSVEYNDEPMTPTGSKNRILHLADVFEQWLERPAPAVRLVMTPGEIRRIES